MNYFEVSNLIDAMGKSPSPSLVQMARDLVSEGYDKTPSADFDPRKVDEQLALISAILSDGFPDVLEETAFWDTIAFTVLYINICFFETITKYNDSEEI